MSLALGALSPELISLIVASLERPLAPYATISRSFQPAIEHLTFGSLSIKSTEIDTFEHLVSDQRREALFSLTFNVVLPAYDDDARDDVESLADVAANDQVFGNSMSRLFSILKSWEVTPPKSAVADKPRPLTLHLYAWSPTDPAYRDQHKLFEQKLDVVLGIRPDIFEKRYENSLLSFPDAPINLPSLTRIIAFYAYGQGSRRTFDAGSVVRIAASLPRLEILEMELKDWLYDSERRQQQRKALAQAFALLPTSSLKRLKLRLPSMTLMDYEYISTIPSMSESAELSDELSSALHNLSNAPKLEGLMVGPAYSGSSTLFWRPDSPISPHPWANLKRIDVSFAPLAPGGVRLFEASETMGWHDEFSDEDSATELIPLPSALEPYFVAASKSAAHMPQLQHLRVAIWKPYSVTTLSWEMEFAAAGISSRFDDWETYSLEGSTPHFQEQNLTSIDCVYWCVRGMNFPERVRSIWKERGLASNDLRVVERRRSPRQSGLFSVSTTNDDLLRMQQALLNS